MTLLWTVWADESSSSQGSSVIGISGSISRETSHSIIPFVVETRNLGIMRTASSSSIPPRHLLMATTLLRSFLDTARASPLTEFAEALPVYQEMVFPSLKYIQSSGASLSSLGPKVSRILSLCADFARSSNGSAVEVIRPVLVSKRVVTETECLRLCEKVAILGLLLGSAYQQLDAKRTELAVIKNSKEDLVAELEHMRSRRRSLEDEADELNKMVQDQQRCLKSTSSLIEDLCRYKRSLDSELQRLSSDAVFCEVLRAKHLSSIEAEFRSCIEDALLLLQGSR